MQDELGGKTMTKWIELRAKGCSQLKDDSSEYYLEKNEIGIDIFFHKNNNKKKAKKKNKNIKNS